MKFLRTIALFLLPGGIVCAQQTPHLAYVYPAGGKIDSTFQITVGGQFLMTASNAFVTGPGVSATVLDHQRPMNQKEFNELRDRFKVLQEKFQATRKGGSPTNVWTAADAAEREQIRAKILKNPPNRTANPAMIDTVTVKIAIGTNAEPGDREIRLATPNALSNPLRFRVGTLREIIKPAAKPANPDLDKFLERIGGRPAPAGTPKYEAHISLPATVNGQIMPGAVDRYRFFAHKGERLVVTVGARELIPYLPDAVPGWFQATLALYDSRKNELAYEDRYRFHPDPVIHFEIPRDDDYTIEIKDSIYRGREDFVYRIALGELPFVTGIFPLGGPTGAVTTVEFKGWNLSETNATRDAAFAEPGIYQLTATNGERVSNLVPFAADTLPECLEQEPNNSAATAQHIKPPVIINGRMDKPGDVDVFRFEGSTGDDIVAEVYARRLDSPLDSTLRLTDADGHQLAFNDDYEDKGSGLNTHHADSYLRATLPTNGTFYLFLADAQHQGGADFGYRLRLSAPQPDFALRIAPSSLGVRGGASAPLTAYAVRRDGFTNAITLELKNAPAGFTLSGAQIPANQNQAKFTLSAPLNPEIELVNISLQGRAMIGGKAAIRPAIPAEDMMQAFAYRHLVPSKELAILVTGRGMPPLRILSATPARIPAGGSVRVRFGPAGPKFTSNFQLELSEPSDGITLTNVSAIPQGVEIELAADAAKVKPGLKGNIVINAFVERPQATGKGRANRRPPVGSLPAIPFEIVPAQ